MLKRSLLHICFDALSPSCNVYPRLVPAVIVMLLFSGCSSEVGEFFDKEHIEIHSKELLRDVSNVEPSPDIYNPLPDVYRDPPEVVTNGKGTKLFYFTRHHSPKILSGLIQQQLGYKISTNEATNQIILELPNEKEAEFALDFLSKVDVPPIQIKIDCLVSELFSDVTLDYETKLDIENLLINDNINTVGDAIGNIISMEPQSNLPQFPGAAARDATRRSSGLKLGFINQVTEDGETKNVFSAVVDLLISRGYTKVLMNPTLRVVNGKKALIKTSDSVPITKTVSGKKEVEPYDITEYKDVIDSLEVTPTAYADGSIGLDVIATIGSKAPEGVSQKLILTERRIENKECRIKPGGSLIIGGIRKSEQIGIVRGVPLLKDIPILGIMFSSKDEEAKGKEILFILTPSISSTGEDHIEMIERIRKKHENPETKRGLLKTMTDPFGQKEYTEHVERKASETETQLEKVQHEKSVLEKEKTRAEQLAEEKKAEAERIAAELKIKEMETEKAKQDAAKAKALADKAKAESQKAKEEAEKAYSEAEKAWAEAQKAKAEAEAQKAKAEAEAKAKAAAEAKAKAEASAKAKAEAEARKAEQEANKAKQEAQEAKEEVEKAKQQKPAPEQEPAPAPEKEPAPAPEAEKPAPAPQPEKPAEPEPAQ